MECHHHIHGSHPGHGCKSHAGCIRLVPIFNHLEEEQMAKIGASVETLALQKGEILFRAGERDDTLYIIHTGKVRIYRLADSGKEQLVRILNPGDFTGELAVFQPGEIHENYAEALQDSTICRMKQKDLQAYLLAYPQIALKILTEITKRLEESEKQTARVAVENVESRIISFLASCVEQSGTNDTVIALPMSKKDLASYLGTTPETISRKFTNLEKQGLIEQLPNKKIKIPDLDELLLYADEATSAGGHH
ncbi:MAG: Crp/Fnr family transcriptional regulator [Heyndrickxia faecalis]|jgi:CRP-like cAMP-binding protein|uniref:Transcriptional regulator, Crp/Fnr family n=2 Tax=Heyndrickxia TaxID=2837504 RepID=G2TRI3_HEYCO|nr:MULTISPECIES: Crp/Fnr family transcriptional regulator [Heyndrickxia]AEP00259.1 transcriptional regulator, Crp/Fnr family [Heyndrickxia coagulans 36D1]APB38056.1 Crp/Fnr family transcriptional regulator [Heyndrickxia coagulans]MBQ4912310.1 Crp/Fnr family transcriptional regulator [Heyndrickxia faecalis]MCI1574856.1 Crp/Fnr family transcriptional regulator [Heyndrickxia coagulans]MEC2306499.1 Crp/Fnr family transcriptional regulator [Weizmannia sp. CD-2023]